MYVTTPPPPITTASAAAAATADGTVWVNGVLSVRAEEVAAPMTAEPEPAAATTTPEEGGEGDGGEEEKEGPLVGIWVGRDVDVDAAAEEEGARRGGLGSANASAADAMNIANRSVTTADVSLC